MVMDMICSLPRFKEHSQTVQSDVAIAQATYHSLQMCMCHVNIGLCFKVKLRLSKAVQIQSVVEAGTTCK